MDANPVNFETAVPLDAALSAVDETDPVARKWAALHDAAAVVAMLAGFSEPHPAELRGVPAALRKAPRWRYRTAEQGIEDLAAIMEPGLAALIAVHTGGGDPAAPARALWQEFVAARDALVALALPRD